MKKGSKKAVIKPTCQCCRALVVGFVLGVLVTFTAAYFITPEPTAVDIQRAYQSGGIK